MCFFRYPLFDKRMASEVSGDSLGDEFKGGQLSLSYIGPCASASSRCGSNLAKPEVTSFALVVATTSRASP